MNIKRGPRLSLVSGFFVFVEGLPQSTEQDSCARITHFGNWLRMVTELPADMAMKVLVTVHLK